MGFSFKSLGHAFAVGFTDAWKGMKAVEKFIAQVDTPQNQDVVTGLTSLIPVYGVPAAAIERGVFAVVGEVAAIMNNVTANGPQKLLDAGFDKAVYDDFKNLIHQVPGLVTTAKSSVVATDPSQLQTTLFNQGQQPASGTNAPTSGNIQSMNPPIPTTAPVTDTSGIPAAANVTQAKSQ